MEREKHQRIVGQLQRELKIKRWPVSECLKSLLVRYNKIYVLVIFL